jgi:hypothetical protein
MRKLASLFTLFFFCHSLFALAPQTPSECIAQTDSSENSLAPRSQAQNLLIDSNRFNFNNVSCGIANLNHPEDVERLTELMSAHPEQVLFLKDFFTQRKFLEEHGDIDGIQEWNNFLRNEHNIPVLSSYIINNILKKIGYVIFYRLKDKAYGEFVMVQPVIDPALFSPLSAQNIPLRKFYFLPTLVTPEFDTSVSAAKFDKARNPMEKMIKSLRANTRLILLVLAKSNPKCHVQTVSPAFLFPKDSQSNSVKMISDFQFKASYPISLSPTSPTLETPYNIQVKGLKLLYYLVDPKRDILIHIQEKQPTVEDEVFDSVILEREKENPKSLAFFEDPENLGQFYPGELLKQKLEEASTVYAKKHGISGLKFQLASISVPTNIEPILTFKGSKKNGHDLDSFKKDTMHITVTRTVPVLSRTEEIKNETTWNIPPSVTQWISQGGKSEMMDENPEIYQDLMSIWRFLFAFPELAYIPINIISDVNGLAKLLYRFSILPPEKQQDRTSILNIINQINQENPEETSKANKFSKVANNIFHGLKPGSISVNVVPRDLDEESFEKIVDEIYYLMTVTNTWFIPYPTIPTLPESKKYLISTLPTEAQVEGNHKIIPDKLFNFIQDQLGCRLIELPSDNKEEVIQNPLRKMISSSLRLHGSHQYFYVRATPQNESEPRIVSANIFQPHYSSWPLSTREGLALDYMRIFDPNFADFDTLPEEQKQQKTKEGLDRIEHSVYCGLLTWDPNISKNKNQIYLLHLIFSFFRASLGGIHPESGSEITMGSAGAGEPATINFTLTTAALIKMVVSMSGDNEIPSTSFLDEGLEEAETSFPFSMEKKRDKDTEIKLDIPYQGSSTVWIRSFFPDELKKFLDPNGKFLTEYLFLGAEVSEEKNVVLVKHRTIGRAFLYSPNTHPKIAEMFSQILAAALHGIKDKDNTLYLIEGLKKHIVELILYHRVYGDPRMLNLPENRKLAILGQDLPLLLEGKVETLRQPMGHRLANAISPILLTSTGQKGGMSFLTTEAVGLKEQYKNVDKATSSTIHMGLGGLENLDMIFLKEVQSAFLFDPNPNLSQMWKEVSNVLIQNRSWNTAGAEIVRSLNSKFDQKELFQFNKDIFLQSEWLKSERGVNFIKGLFRGGAIQYRVLDLNNIDDLQNLAAGFSDANLSIDSLYLGDIQSWEDKENKLHNIRETLTRVVKNTTLIVEQVRQEKNLAPKFRATPKSAVSWFQYLLPDLSQQSLKAA